MAGCVFGERAVAGRELGTTRRRDRRVYSFVSGVAGGEVEGDGEGE